MPKTIIPILLVIALALFACMPGVPPSEGGSLFTYGSGNPRAAPPSAEAPNWCFDMDPYRGVFRYGSTGQDNMAWAVRFWMFDEETFLRQNCGN